MIRIPTTHILIEVAWGLFAATVALSGAAIIPRWNDQVQYCVPRTDCQVVKAVDTQLFQWHQEQAQLQAEKLKRRALALKPKNNRWGDTLVTISDDWQQATESASEFVVGIQHTFAPKSDKEFLQDTAQARRFGWTLEAVQMLPGFAPVRKGAGAASLIVVIGGAWLVGQLEILQQKRDRRAALDEDFALEQHRKALEGEKEIVHAEIDWETAAEHKQLEARYLGSDYETFIDAETKNIDNSINRQESMQGQLTGQSLDEVNDPSDKIDYKAEPKFAIGPSQNAVKLDKSEDTAWRILYSVLSSRLSTLLIGTTGAGKSVFQCAWIIELAKRSPDLQIYAVVQKQDYPAVISSDRVVFFDQNDPSPALNQITKVWNIYDQRRRSLKEFKASGKLTPVKLILADWLSVSNALKEMSTDQTVKASKYLTKIMDIAVNGRATNVSLIADLQSFNIEALGIKADVNIRKNFNIFGLGNYSMDDDGTVNDSYGVLDNLFQNQYLIPDEELRKKLKVDYQRLKPTSRSHSRPIMFTSLDPMSVVLMPDLRHYENYNLNEKRGTLSDGGAFLEGLLPKNETKQPEDSSPTLSTEAQKVIAWLNRKHQEGLQWITTEQCRASGCVQGAKTADIKAYFHQIVEAQRGELNERGDIRLI